jgi:hypothetical protein
LTVTDILESALRIARAREDASSNAMTVGTGSSNLREPRLAQFLKTALGILGVLVDDNASVAFDCEKRFIRITSAASALACSSGPTWA